ncbi:fic family toxin-antitoxin system, toxin component [Streptomyces sp. NPDC050617]|uniref:fic family toxin-antitoxin system, toxin component n=1 Tax=Streptomyces sp. NPDC050617 TaxID=3154628 RepID=UPI00344A4A50
MLSPGDRPARGDGRTNGDTGAPARAQGGGRATAGPDVDLAWVLETAEDAGAYGYGRAPADFGVGIAAVERHRAGLLGRPVYDSAFERAAALAHALSLDWLERANTTVAAACAVRYLSESGPVRVPGRAAVAELARELRNPARTVRTIAAVLRHWS